MKKNIMLHFAVFTAVAILFAAVIFSQVVFFSTKDLSIETPIGIIDGSLSAYHPVISETNIDAYAGSDTHGDKMLDFLAHFDVGKVYYFDASSDGTVSSRSIIEGLEWMKTRGVRYVNISMSSKQYSQELADWIADNQNDITVYASFSNVPQSADYPAMYNGVIASGVEPDFADDTDDLIYSAYNIVLDWNVFSVYAGNSYLSLWSMINQINGM